MENICNCIDYIALGLSILSIIATISLPIIFYHLRPNLKIEIERPIENQKIPIEVINEETCSDAINLNLEVCTVRGENNTKHLKFDKEDFLILSRKRKNNDENKRVFKANCSESIMDKLKESGTILRVRVYATHSYSSFGRAFEKKFRYDVKRERFIEEE